jgi:hypothetical protein
VKSRNSQTSRQKAGIKFNHVSASDNRYVVESMSGGVLLIDYDRDGYPDLYFTNAPTVDMAIKGQTARGALYHNNHDGTFTDETEKAGLVTPCFAMGAPSVITTMTAGPTSTSPASAATNSFGTTAMAHSPT